MQEVQEGRCVLVIALLKKNSQLPPNSCLPELALQARAQLGTQPLQPGHNSLGKAELHHLHLAHTLPWGHLHSSDVQLHSAETHMQEAKIETVNPVYVV